MNENEFGARVARALEVGLDDLEAPVVRRLAEIRASATARARSTQSLGSLSLAGHGGRSGMRLPSFRRRILWPTLALIAGLIGTWYWQSLNAPQEGDEIDLLASELPLGVFIDKGFDQWLHASSKH